MPTVGEILLKHGLPDSLKQHVTNLNKGGINNLFEHLAKDHPEKFNEIASHITRLGFDVASRSGSSVTLDDLNSPIDKDARFKEIDKEIAAVKKEKLSKAKESEKIADIYTKHFSQIDKDIMSEGLKHGKTLAKIISAGSRGSVHQYRATVLAPGIMTNAEGEPMFHMPITHSFSEGLTLPEYLTTTYSTRNSEVEKKMGTSSTGYYAKQLSRSSMTIIVEEHDCGTENGVPYPTSDNESIGCFLASEVKSYKRNNEVTSSMLNDLQHKKVKSVTVRSPITCESSKHFHPGAVCQLCAGIRENGLPPIGSYLGVNVASSTAEGLTQGALGNKHKAKEIGKSKEFKGFDAVNQFSNIPSSFPNEALIAPKDGTITSIKKADAGGHYLKIDDHEHYIQPEFNIFVKPGDKVEKGDVLSDGIINPSTIVDYKGIGEGRKHYADALHKIFKATGVHVNRRNFEVIAKNAISHVKITDPDGIGEYTPDAIVNYQNIASGYKPREDSKLMRTDQAKGKYLENPILHYTIGSPVSSSMINTLRENGIESITVNDRKPGFDSHMVRLLEVPAEEPDWGHVLYSTYMERRLRNIVNSGKGSYSDTKGPSPILGISTGVGFNDRQE